jgi:hypothetical protein
MSPHAYGFLPNWKHSFFHEERQCKGKAHENEERYEERYRDPFIHNVSNHIKETGKNL